MPRLSYYTTITDEVGEKDYNFVAQELQSAQEAAGADWLNLVLNNNPDRLEATPGKLIPILVKAIQELLAEMSSLKAQLAAV